MPQNPGKSSDPADDRRLAGRPVPAHPRRGWRWLKEPLLHFVAVGALLFVANAWFSSRPAVEPTPVAPPAVVPARVIEMDAARIGELRETYGALWGRPPTEAELREIVQEKVREEVLYRHALELELDRDDPVVRRRLVQRVRFLTQDLAANEPVEEAALQRFLDEQAEAYTDPPQVAFDQLWFDPERSGIAAPNAAAAALEKLRESPETWRAHGDPTPLEPSYPSLSERQINSLFGRAFADVVMQTSPGDWFGPVESRHGWHLVRVTGREVPEPPSLEEVRPRVQRDYEAAQRDQAGEAYYQDLRQRFEVRIDEAAIEAAGREAGEPGESSR